jgi:MFS transporter, DHA1 family, tetracycline resistance protein
LCRERFWIQPRLGEKRLAYAGLALMAAGLAGMALAAQDWLLYPLVGMVAFGSGVGIPSLAGLASNQVEGGSQGRLMGGMQVLLSLTTIIGPTAAGLSFEYIGVPAPYWLGGLLSAVALFLAGRAFRSLT